MPEWVWLTLAAREDAAQSVKMLVDATLAGDPNWPAKKPAARFREYVIRRECADLKLCGDIANEAKHFLRRPASISTMVSARTPAPFVGPAHMAPSFFHPDFPQPGVEPIRWIPKIVTAEGQSKAIDTFKSVLAFWRRLLDEKNCSPWIFTPHPASARR